MTPAAQPPFAKHRHGYSLLEVILAVAILAGAVAVISHVMHIGTRSASEARDLARAQLLCEAKMAEITSGVAEASAAEQVPFDTDPEWLYSVAIESTDREGLLFVRVTVGQDPDAWNRPVTVSLVRLIPDPAVEPAEESESEDSSTESQSGGNDA